MNFLGQIGERKIFYVNIRLSKDWFEEINFKNWIAFTIADDDDKAFLNEMIGHSLAKGVCYVCCAGQLASLTEDCFDEQIVWQQVQLSNATGMRPDYESVAMTSFHNSLSEGFWFAATTANQIINDHCIQSTEVVCIDCTKHPLQSLLGNLIESINNGWLPAGD